MLCTPLFWSGSKSAVPTFFQHDFIAFLDVRSCTKQRKNRIQEIVISMDIPCHVQQRSALVLYASGVILETFQQAVSQENIILPFGKEQGFSSVPLLQAVLRMHGRLTSSLLEALSMKPTGLRMMVLSCLEKVWCIQSSLPTCVLILEPRISVQQ